VVNRVVITLGTADIFAFNGSTVTPGGNDTTNNIVAGDDVVLAEPAPARPPVTATAGVPVSGVLDTFTESSPGSALRATIDWGDGAQTAGTIGPGAGGTLVVTGNHAYAKSGNYTAIVTVDDFQGPQQTTQTAIQVGPRASNTTVSCSPSSVAVSASTMCTVAVTDADAGTPSTPTGVVAVSSPTPGASFAGQAACILGPSPLSGTALCVVEFTPNQLLPFQARVLAAYGGDDAHAASSSETVIGVHRQRCSLKALSRRLRRAGFGLLVTCDARTNVTITAKAVVARRGRLKGFSLPFGTARALVGAGRPTVIVIRPARGVLPVLRTARQRHRRVSLKLTLTAASRVSRTKTTARVAALRLP
jgi:hypothetical protein